MEGAGLILTLDFMTFMSPRVWNTMYVHMRLHRLTEGREALKVVSLWPYSADDRWWTYVSSLGLTIYTQDHTSILGNNASHNFCFVGFSNCFYILFEFWVWQSFYLPPREIHLQVPLPNGPITWETYEQLVEYRGEAPCCTGWGAMLSCRITTAANATGCYCIIFVILAKFKKTLEV